LSETFLILRRIQRVLSRIYRDADKSLARSGRKQARKHVRDARDFNNIETRAVINFFFLQDKAQKEIHAILTETFACFLPGRDKDLSAPVNSSIYVKCLFVLSNITEIWISSTNFSKKKRSSTLFHINPSSGAVLFHTDSRMDGET